MSKEVKKGRRSFLKYIVTGIICGVAAGAGGYVAGVAIAPKPTIIRTETKTITKTKFPKLEEIKKIKSTIKTEVQGATVYYREESFWTEEDFLRILENKDEFSFNCIDKFVSSVSTYGKEAVNLRVEFNSEENSTILTDEVYGAISKTGNRYYATFEWLIRPMELDFIDDHFEETEQGLSWEGKINGVPTEIICEFPYTGSPYKAWAHPTGHCHAHVWWEI